VTDSLFLVALGYAAGCPGGGWACALLAALTAYVRVLGGALGQMQDFRGPMAKSHRMAALTVACVCAAVPSSVSVRCEVLMVAIVVIAAGSLLTIVNRARVIGSQLRAES
jgi:phosphatidylglycerophosphate synthase